MLATRPPSRFRDGHLALAAELLDPFSVALENDQRIRELRSLREAVEAENRTLLSKLGRHDISDSIVGSDTGLKAVMEEVDRVARSDAPVLILGETGTGKEVVARAIHTRSRRARGPFLRINCGAIPPDLVDSELFGHEKGSFTAVGGAAGGGSERADGGTLFLDECGNSPGRAGPPAAGPAGRRARAGRR
ncbi:MAG: sigma 54-interacting transcriptional regulator [Isosphaeraceae bacterium]